jgi:hypothetical protein
MRDPGKEAALQEPRVRELLLGHFLRVEGLLWPGGDALTLDDVVRDYVQLVATGRVPGCQELQRSHPELTDLLNAIFHV